MIDETRREHGRDYRDESEGPNPIDSLRRMVEVKD